MVLKMKNLTFRGGGFTKNWYKGEHCLKRAGEGGLGQLAGLGVGAWGGLGKNEGGGVFEEAFIPQYTLWKLDPSNELQL